MNLTRGFSIALLSIFGLAPGVADGQILVSSFLDGTVAEYSLSGQLVNSSFISGLNQPEYLAADPAGNIYVSNWGNNAVSKRTAADGTVNLSLFQTVSSGFQGLSGIAVDQSGNIFVSQMLGNANIAQYSTSGVKIKDPLFYVSVGARGPALDGLGNIYVPNQDLGIVGKYTTSGSTINASLIQNLGNPSSVVADGQGHLFVATFSGTIGEYDLDGTPVNASLITGLSGPSSIALDGNGHLFVVEEYIGRIGEYTTSGTTVNASFITDVNHPWGILVVPEPSSLALLMFAFAALTFRHARRRSGVTHEKKSDSDLRLLRCGFRTYLAAPLRKEVIRSVTCS